jgi:hypothetical protein
MSEDLRKLVDAMKDIPMVRSWGEPNRNYLSWVSPLDIDGVTVGGLQVRVEAHEHNPDEFVRAQLEYHPPKGKCEPLARVEWRPLSKHNNKGRGPEEYQFKPFRQTHVHRFDMNWDAELQRLLSPNLPIAVPIQDIDSFDKFLDICNIELKIRNMSIVPVPPWQPRIL